MVHKRWRSVQIAYWMSAALLFVWMWTEIQIAHETYFPCIDHPQYLDRPYDPAACEAYISAEREQQRQLEKKSQKQASPCRPPLRCAAN